MLSADPPQVAGGLATAPFTLEVTFTNRVSGRGSARTRYTAALRLADRVWKLTEIRTEQ